MLQQRLHWSSPRPLGLILPAAEQEAAGEGAEQGTVPSTVVALPVIFITQIQ